MTRSLTKLALAAATLLLLAACGGGAPAVDPYADPGTPPPPPVTDPTIVTSGSIAASSKGPGLFDINVAGFAMPEVEAEALRAAGLSPESIADLPPSAFTVVEDGVVKGITVERISAGSRAAADLVFVFDTTGSMGYALTSVQDSIVAFADYLEDGGLDVRLGAVTFGDAFDTQSDTGTRGTSLRGDAPPAFDTSERPTFALSDDFDAFREFIEGDTARAGGDGPENAYGATEFAYDEFDWRPGAQKLMVVITDICQHSPETFTTQFDYVAGYEAWLPPSQEALINKLRGNATVHAIGPDTTWFGCTETYDVANLAGAAGTGGVFHEWMGTEVFDLTELPIAAAARGGYVITYRGTTDGGEPKEVRVVIDDGGNVRGEFSIVGDY